MVTMTQTQLCWSWYDFKEIILKKYLFSHLHYIKCFYLIRKKDIFTLFIVYLNLIFSL